MRPARALAVALLAGALAAGFAAVKKAPVAAPPATAATTPRTQQDASLDFIRFLLLGERDSMAALFEDTLRRYVSDEWVRQNQSRFKWLYDFVGGDFVQFHSGGTDSFFFREYRLANESNERYPLVVIQTVFNDSLDPELVGGQVKSFLGPRETRVAESQTWTVDGRSVDIHAINLVETPQGPIMAIQFFDEDTAQSTRESVGAAGIALIREALARGYMDSAYALLTPGQTLSADVGVVYIRKDPHVGFTHSRVSFGPELYAPIDSSGTAGAPQDEGKKKKASPEKKKKQK